MNDCINNGNIANQFLRNGVTIPQARNVVRTHPYLMICTLPDEYFKGQIKCEEGRNNNQGSATFRIAKDQHVCLLHCETDGSRPSTMVNVCKEGKIAAAYDFRRRSNVSCTENGLGLVTTPSAVGGVPDIVESFMFLTFFLINHSLLYKLNYRFKEPLAFSHQEKYMTTFKREHF